MVRINSSPFIDPEGNFVGAVLVAKDITLLGAIERELEDRHQFQNIIGKSKKMQDIYTLLEDLANLETTVLVTGESGTGKELIAKALHFSGRRSAKPFVAVNCSALAESLLESELFGHVKGAFTGAVMDKQGRFETADGGTLLLDEIGDISPLIQLKLLRVIQEKEFERVGESSPRKVDVRVIAATNKDLKEKVKAGKFREDLYYRLKVVEIPLPPLRERREEIPLLVNHSCQMFNKIFNKTIDGISSDVLTLFMEYPWPGNIRELKHAIECAFVLCHEKIISTRHLPPEIGKFRAQTKASISAVLTKKPHSRENITEALNKAFWNKTKTAQNLGISRQTLYRKMNEFRIDHKM
jgi:transcriptional regulator with PAS, ATPase and Fis domain